MFEESYTSSAFEALLRDDYQLVSLSRRGISSQYFLSIVDESPFSLNEWSQLLHLGERAVPRMLEEKQNFGVALSERILDISRVLRHGESVFGNRHDFRDWLEIDVPALGNIQPKSLLDNTFGIGILRDELTRIEHGVF
ncbi:MAG: antitoxin Xre/MbcA/ParS toxin-binding domain-containing protein [Saprospiraceae bacterium]